MIAEWYVGFWRPAPLRSVLTGKSPIWQVFTHVEAWGYTHDRTWLFFDPKAEGSTIVVTHHYDEVQELLSERFAGCEMILRLEPPDRQISIPVHPTMNCSTQVGHLLGIRAYTPWSLRRSLLACGAEVIHAKSPPRGSRGQAYAGDGAAPG